MAIKVGTGNSDGYSPGAYYKASKPAVIDPNDKVAFANWCNVLGLSERELTSAIREFGPRVRDIRRGLRADTGEAA